MATSDQACLDQACTKGGGTSANSKTWSTPVSINFRIKSILNENVSFGGSRVTVFKHQEALAMDALCHILPPSHQQTLIF